MLLLLLLRLLLLLLCLGRSALPASRRACVWCPSCPAHPHPPAGRQTAAALRDPGTYPTPLFFLWPPDAEAAPYLGAAHGLMGEQ